MIAVMAIAFFLIELVVLVLGALGVAVLIAVVTKRPTIAVIAGLVMLFLVAVSIASIWLSVTHSPRSALVPPGMNVYPDLQSVDAPSVVQTPQFAPIAGESHTKVRFGFFVVFPFLIAVVLGIFVALASRSNKSAEHRGRWWPAMLLLPLIAAPAFLIGVWTSDRSVGPRRAAKIEMMPQDFWPHINVMRQQQSAERARQEARQRMAEAQAEVRRAQQQIAEQSRANSPQPEEAKRVAEHATEDAVNALLQTQFATMDINALIEMFQAPKIDLSNTAAEAETPSSQVTSAPAVVVATISSDGAANAAVEAAAVGKKDADASETASSPVEAEVDGDQPGLSAPPAPSAAPRSEPKPLPEWVNNPPSDYQVIETDEYATAEECRQAMDIYLMLETAERVQSLAGHPYVDRSRPSLTFDREMVLVGGNALLSRGSPLAHSNDDRLRLIGNMGIGIDEIRRFVVRGEYLAERNSPRAFDTMYKKYTLAQFTPSFDQQLRRHWDSYRRQERFEIVGGWAGAVLGLLGFVFGLLKIDTWTKGYYSKRLFIGVPAAIIGFVFILMVWNEVHF